MGEGGVVKDLVGAEETTGETRLWQAVVVRAIEDWISGPLRQQLQAEHYIFSMTIRILVWSANPQD